MSEDKRRTRAANSRTDGRGSSDRPRRTGDGTRRPSDGARRADERYYSDRSQRTAPRRGKKRRKKPNPLKILGGWLTAVVAALAIALILRLFIFDVVQVNTDAMSAAVQRGDIVLMTKFDYWLSKPVRGDVVGFTASSDKALSIRRVVGTPNDQVSIEAGYVLLDGEAMPEAYVSDAPDVNYQEVQIGSNKFLLLGDSRSNSEAGLGSEVKLTDFNKIQGKVRYRVWPLNRLGAVK